MKHRFRLLPTLVLLMAAMILLSACGKDASSLTIASENNEYRVAVEGKVQAIIAPNTLPKGTKVAIKEIKQLMDHDFAGLTPVGLFEISSSEEGAFRNPIILEFTYDGARLDPTQAAVDQLAIAYFDETYQRWQETDFEIDESNAKVFVKTNHLSLWSLFFQDDQYVTTSSPNFTIYFNKDANAPAIGQIVSGDPIYEYAVIVRTALYDAYKAYGDAPFKLPNHTKVYIDDWGADKEAQWGWFSKNIEIPVTYIYESELQLVSAHELFHAVQNQYLNFASMASNRWWMEATADYAAAYLATQHGLKENLKLTYLAKGINHDETFHTYQTAHFVKYLVDSGLNFPEMFTAVMTGEGGALENLAQYSASKSMPLSSLYDEFAYRVIFSDQVQTEALQTDIYTDLVNNKLEMNLDTAMKMTELVNVSSNYASSMAGIKLSSEQDTSFDISLMALEPTSGVKVQYVLADGPGKNKILDTGYLSHNAFEMTVHDGNFLYFLVTNFAPQNGSVTIVVNQESKPQPYNNTRTAKIYNDDFLVDVDLKLVSSAPFTISREIIDQDTLFLTFDFLKSDKDISIEAEAIVENLRFASPGDWGNREPVIKEMYWSTATGDIPGTKTSLVIPAGDTQIKSFGYSLVFDIHNLEEDAYYWGGGSALVLITIRILD